MNNAFCLHRSVRKIYAIYILFKVKIQKAITLIERCLKSGIIKI